MTPAQQEQIIEDIERDDLEGALSRIAEIELAASDTSDDDESEEARAGLVDLLILKATALLRLEAYAESLPVLNDIVEVEPGNPVALLMLGTSLAQVDQQDAARRVFAVVARIGNEPWVSEARNALAALDGETQSGNNDTTLIELSQKPVGQGVTNVVDKAAVTIANPAGGRPKLSIICGAGLDSFIMPVRTVLEERYEVRLHTVASSRDVAEALEWADVCWFEWCDESLVRASKSLSKKAKVVCRIHSYEVFTSMPKSVNWDFVDQIIFVADHVRDIFDATVPSCTTPRVVIPNGIDLERYEFKKRAPGYNLAYLGYINYKKNFALLLQIVAKLVAVDKRYKLHIAGAFQDLRDRIYFDHMVQVLGIEANVDYSGWADEPDAWLADKDYVLSTSTFESFGMSIAEGMAAGIKPVVHDWPGARGIYPEEMLFRTVDEAVEMIRSPKYVSEAYRAFIADHYELQTQVDAVAALLEQLMNVEEESQGLAA